MAGLQPIKPLIDELVRKSSEIDTLEDQLEIPLSIKERFGVAWGKDFVVKSDYIKLKTARAGEAARQTEIFDPALIKCAHAVDLFNAYGAYKKQAERVRDAEPDPLTTSEWKLLGEDRKEPLPSNLKAKITAKINALTDLTDGEKKLLNLFMVAEKAEREELLGAYKGLSRGDSFAPVAAKAFGMRVDYSGYINDVIEVLVHNPDIAREILAVQPLGKMPKEKSASSVATDIAGAFGAVCNFCAAYDKADSAWVKNRPECMGARKHLSELQDWLMSQFGKYKGQTLRAKFATGTTYFPKVPWVCLLPEGQEVIDGVYVSICFDRKGRGAVSGFAESSTNPKGLPVVKRTGKELNIDVDGSSSKTHFNDGFVNPEEFFKDSFDAEKLRAHIAKSLDLCLDYLGGNQSPPMTPDDKHNFVAALQECGFVAEEGLPGAFLQSLIAKPFVILTGNSGTGKTKIAELLATWLRGDDSDGHELVAVGADWTDNRNIVGFVNYLRLSGDGKTPLYQSTHLLDLVMRARATPRKPFFLILDEMNLSHVERYFADFLSAMESRAGELDLHSDGGELEQLPVEPDGPPVVPRKLSIPSNVFVIGTVNVDETTYMFSPKVLDRANVIEFRMPDNAVESFLKADASKGLAIDYAGNGVCERFLALSTQARADLLPEISDVEATKKLSEAFAGVFDLMRDSRLEFGFRTINEISRYLRVDYELAKDKAAWSWQNAFDSQLLQKILPKLSGSRRKLEDLLVRLAIFCESGKAAAPGGTAPAHLQSVPIKREARPQYSNSYRKLCDMLDAVRRDQFVSFIH